MRISATRVQGLAQGGIAALMPSLMLDFTKEAESGRASPWWNLFKGGVASPDEFVNDPAHNLIVQSSALNLTPWALSNSSYVGGKLIDNTSAADHGTAQTVIFPVNTSVTFQFKAKVAEYTQVRLSATDQTTGPFVVRFDIAAGSVYYSVTTGSWTGLTTSVGPVDSNGYRLCTATVTRGAGTQAVFSLDLMVGTTSAFAGTGTSGLFITDVQLNLGAATAYVPTSTAAVPLGSITYGPHNLARNGEAAGATVGGSLPTYWGIAQTPPGITIAVAAVGAGYVDIRISGTTSGQKPLITFESAPGWSAGQQVYASLTVQVLSGGDPAAFVTVQGAGIGGTAVQTNVLSTPAVISMAGTALSSVIPWLNVSIVNGAPVDMVLRLSKAQVCLGTAQSYLATSGTAIYSSQPRITFNRASAATRVMPNGTIGWAPHNLAVKSESFVTADSQGSGVTVLPSDSVMLAGVRLYRCTAAMQQPRFEGGIDSLGAMPIGQTRTGAFYAQKIAGNAVNTVSIGVYMGTALWVTFDLTTGAVSYAGSAAGWTFSGGSIAVGAGWRVWATFTNNSGSSSFTGMKLGNFSSVGPETAVIGSDAVHMGGFQVNLGLLQPYYPTGSGSYHGPRFTYDYSEQFASELVSNGTFDSSTTGWTPVNDVTVAASSGRLVVTRGAVGNYAYTTCTLVVGKTYRLSWDAQAGTASPYVFAGTSPGVGNVMAANGNTGALGYTFVAASTSLVIGLGTNGGTAGANVSYDNVSVKEITGPVIETVGPELVSNGTFNTDTTGWSVNNGTISQSGGKLVITSNTTGAFVASQPLTLVPGKTYRFTCDFVDVAGTGASINVMTAQFGSTIANAASTASAGNTGTLSFVFVATVASVWVSVRILNATASGQTTVYDNVSVRELTVTTTSTTVCQGLLVEEQRTNHLLWSESFDNTAWGATGVSVINANCLLAPNGSYSADRFVENVSTATGHTIEQYAGSLVSGQIATISLWVKPIGRRYIGLHLSGTAFSNSISVIVLDSYTGLMSGVSGAGAPTNYGVQSYPNGWFRIYSSAAANASGNVLMQVRPYNGLTYADRNYDGDGSSGMGLWRAQLEVGTSFGPPTSHIPTTAASATRVRDLALMSGTDFSSWFNQDQGTFYADSLADGTTGDVFRTNNRAINILKAPTYRRFESGIAAFETAPAISNGSPLRIAGSYNSSTVSFSCQGRLIRSQGNTGSGLVDTDVTFGKMATPSLVVSRLAYYRSRLPDAQLQRLTA